MIEQIPRVTYAVSLDRTRTIRTRAGEFSIHHIIPELFDGFEGQTGLRAGSAVAEKALFDTIYLLAARSGHFTLPEVELPDNFDETKVWRWVEYISSVRLRSIVTKNLQRTLRASSRV
jgi:hypothetical protein